MSMLAVDEKTHGLETRVRGSGMSSLFVQQREVRKHSMVRQQDIRQPWSLIQ